MPKRWKRGGQYKAFEALDEYFDGADSHEPLHVQRDTDDIELHNSFCDVDREDVYYGVTKSRNPYFRDVNPRDPYVEDADRDPHIRDIDSCDSYNRSKDRDPYDRPKDLESYDRPKDLESYDRPRDREPYDRSRDQEPYSTSRDREPYNRSRDQEPYDRPMDREPYDRPVDREPYDRPVDREPYDRPVDRDPYDRPVDRKPYDRLVNQEPYDRLGDRQPYDRPMDREPCDRPMDREPYDRPGVQEPYDRPVDREPYDRLGDRQPYDRPVDREPYDRPMDREPCDRPVDREPYDRPVDRKPYDRPMDRKPYNRPVDREPYDRPGDLGPYDRPMDQDPYDKPMDQDPYNKPVDREPYNRPVNREPYDRPGDQEPYRRLRDRNSHDRSRDGDPHDRSKDGDPYDRSRNRDGERYYGPKDHNPYYNRVMDSRDMHEGSWEDHRRVASTQEKFRAETFEYGHHRPSIGHPKNSGFKDKTVGVVGEGAIQEDEVPLPEELAQLLKAWKCDICICVLPNKGQAEVHYSGRQHFKRVRRYLDLWSERERRKAPECWLKMACNKKGYDVVRLPNDGSAERCKVCNIKFLSQIVARQHYEGEEHEKAVQIYLKENPGANVITKASLNAPPPKLYCDICNVSTTSKEHLLNHLQGNKHKKMVKRLEEDKAVEMELQMLWSFDEEEAEYSGENVAPSQRGGVPSSSGGSTKYQNLDGDGDYSHITDFFCKLCNVKLASEEEVDLHIGSRDHRNKKQGTLTVGDPVAEDFKCDLCKMNFPSQSAYDLHLKWKSHVEKENEAAKIKADRKHQTCELCRMDFFSDKSYKAHFSTPLHIGNEKWTKEWQAKRSKSNLPAQSANDQPVEQNKGSVHLAKGVKSSAAKSEEIAEKSDKLEANIFFEQNLSKSCESDVSKIHKSEDRKPTRDVQSNKPVGHQQKQTFGDTNKPICSQQKPTPGDADKHVNSQQKPTTGDANRPVSSQQNPTTGDANKPISSQQKPTTGDGDDKPISSQQKPTSGNDDKSISSQQKPTTGDDDKPISSQQKPTSGNDDNSISSQQKPTTGDDDKPISSQQKPTSGDSNKPISSQQKPTTGDANKPISSQQKPTTGDNDKPISSQQKPTTADDDKPISSQQKPTTGDDDKPISSQQKPTTGDDDKPISSQQKPTSGSDDKSISSQQKPTTGDTNKPVSSQQKPTTGDANKPISSQQKPTTGDDDKPISSQQKPTTGDDDDKPISSQQKPTSGDSNKPISSQQKHASGDTNELISNQQKPTGEDTNKQASIQQKLTSGDTNKQVSIQEEPISEDTNKSVSIQHKPSYGDNNKPVSSQHESLPEGADKPISGHPKSTSWDTNKPISSQQKPSSEGVNKPINSQQKPSSEDGNKPLSGQQKLMFTVTESSLSSEAFHCEICNYYSKTINQHDSHMKSSKHKSTVASSQLAKVETTSLTSDENERKGFLKNSVEVCARFGKPEVTSPDAMSNNSDMKAPQKCTRVQRVNSRFESECDHDDDDDDVDDTKIFECKLCGVSVVSSNLYEQHVGSMKHILKLAHQQISSGDSSVVEERKKAPETRYCEVCNYLSSSSDQHNSHLQSNKHKSTVAALEITKSKSKIESTREATENVKKVILKKSTEILNRPKETRASRNPSNVSENETYQCAEVSLNKSFKTSGFDVRPQNIEINESLRWSSKKRYENDEILLGADRPYHDRFSDNESGSARDLISSEKRKNIKLNLKRKAPPDTLAVQRLETTKEFRPVVEALPGKSQTTNISPAVETTLSRVYHSTEISHAIGKTLPAMRENTTAPSTIKRALERLKTTQMFCPKERTLPERTHNTTISRGMASGHTAKHLTTEISRPTEKTLAEEKENSKILHADGNVYRKTRWNISENPPQKVIPPPHTIVQPPQFTVPPPHTTVKPPQFTVPPPQIVSKPPQTIVPLLQTIVSPPQTIVPLLQNIVPPPQTVVTRPQTIVPPSQTVVDAQPKQPQYINKSNDLRYMNDTMTEEQRKCLLKGLSSPHISSVMRRQLLEKLKSLEMNPKKCETLPDVDFTALKILAKKVASRPHNVQNISRGQPQNSCVKSCNETTASKKHRNIGKKQHNVQSTAVEMPRNIGVKPRGMQNTALTIPHNTGINSQYVQSAPLTIPHNIGINPHYMQSSALPIPQNIGVNPHLQSTVLAISQNIGINPHVRSTALSIPQNIGINPQYIQSTALAIPQNIGINPHYVQNTALPIPQNIGINPHVQSTAPTMPQNIDIKSHYMQNAALHMSQNIGVKPPGIQSTALEGPQDIGIKPHYLQTAALKIHQNIGTKPCDVESTVRELRRNSGINPWNVESTAREVQQISVRSTEENKEGPDQPGLGGSTGKRFACKVCRVNCSCSSELREHTDCQEHLANVELLRRFISRFKRLAEYRNTTDDPYRCFKCNISCATLRDFNRHILDTHWPSMLLLRKRRRGESIRNSTPSRGEASASSSATDSREMQDADRIPEKRARRYYNCMLCRGSYCLEEYKIHLRSMTHRQNMLDFTHKKLPLDQEHGGEGNESASSAPVSRETRKSRGESVKRKSGEVVQSWSRKKPAVSLRSTK